ncbi:intracellular protease/amidase [Methanocella sp. CWC-04]|uniref:Intracellular protease/amidase n=1 Tax=Methanooceanicella nereidis TaxID=2052831 RepID=A0AAP2RDX7_9EURY|nr:DJ-1/PfpI family protein [Methanocella sp. CWC-04]MCD1295876.1 intracellular protease/amidase [Methanocella sp. CWC-04]
MNVCVFYYDGFCESEIVLSIWGRPVNFIFAALEDRIYISEEKQKYLPDKTIGELIPDDIDIFIIPGGDPSHLYDNIVLKDFIKALDEKNKWIAGICGGSFLMAKYGLLDGKKCTGSGSGVAPDSRFFPLYEKSHLVNEDVVIDGNKITATGQAFVEFAIAIGKVMGIYKNEDEIKMEYNWLKNIKG